MEPIEPTKKLLYQYEAMMKLTDEKLSRHQAWESEPEVGSQGRVGRWEVAGVGVCLNYVRPYFPIQVLEILKLREEEEEGHALTISWSAYYLSNKLWETFQFLGLFFLPEGEKSALCRAHVMTNPDEMLHVFFARM